MAQVSQVKIGPYGAPCPVVVLDISQTEILLGWFPQGDTSKSIYQAHWYPRDLENSHVISLQ